VAEGIQKIRDGMEVKPVPYTGDVAAVAAAQAAEAKP
jgi:hypothetical protein